MYSCIYIVQDNLLFAVLFLEIHIFVLFSKVYGHDGRFRKSPIKTKRAELLIFPLVGRPRSGNLTQRR